MSAAESFVRQTPLIMWPFVCLGWIAIWQWVRKTFGKGLLPVRCWAARVLVPELAKGDVRRLVALYRVLPEDERKVLDHIATRMHDVGLASYGPMSIETDRRDMPEEERQELYDACVYRALGNLRSKA